MGESVGWEQRPDASGGTGRTGTGGRGARPAYFLKRRIITGAQASDGARKLAGPAPWRNLAEARGVGLGPEADQQAAVALQHRPLDHRRLRQHQVDRLGLIQARLVGVRQLAEGCARAVEQGLPADLPRPTLQPAAVDALGLVVVEFEGDAMIGQPGPGLVHRVAGLDAVDRGHSTLVRAWRRPV